MLERLRRLVGGSWTAVREEDWRFELDGVPLPLPVAIHPLRAPRVVLILPGYDGAIDGYQDKYVKVAELLRQRGVGAVVRTGNHVVPGFGFEATCLARLRGLLGEIARRAASLCDHARPELYLLGVSAGASAMAALGHEWPAVRKMLLVAPSADAGPERVEAGLAAFTGELFVVAGEEDEVVGDYPRALPLLATRAARRELRLVPGCDHQFRGAQNGRIFSQAPLWAFLGDEPFPDPRRGIHLYD